jgi:D-3-phosphoglycerate dehydrogenase
MIDAETPAFIENRGPGPHTFFFDFDGTIYPGESLEEVLALALAGDPMRAERIDALEQLGRRGMEGDLIFDESLRGRLDIVCPHRRHIDAWLAEAATRVIPVWTGLLSDLHSAGHNVIVMSGGFRSCIEPVVQRLGVEPHHVYCNEFRFGGDGWVIGLDEGQALSRQGGKPWTVRTLVAQGAAPGLRVMVGDGATDLEAVAQGACHGMIGYGVHAVRSTVRERADIFFEQAEHFDSFLRTHFL